MRDYQICSRCIMDTKSSPNITFDEQGVCCYCHQYDRQFELFGYKGRESDEKLKALVKQIKEEEKDKEYDCILGISGGVDSSYLAYLSSKLGLRVLAVHVDAGWNSEIAVENIQKMCKKLDIDLHTIVINWPSIKELQRAYMFSGLPNLDVPQDHVFLACMYDYAIKNHIRYMLNGSNLATEGILPENFGHASVDFMHMQSIYQKKGRGKKIFDKYPHFSLFRYAYMQKRIKIVKLLNYIPYSKKQAIELLKKEFDWQYYGGKHFESRFTKFFQSYYLPYKFGFEKKRAHLSSLIVGGEMTREEAMEEMKDNSSYPLKQMLEDKDYIIKKLDISPEQWDEIMKQPITADEYYKGSTKYLNMLIKIKRWLIT